MQKSLFSLFLILAATLSMLGCGSSSSNSELRSIDEYVNVIKMYLDQRYHFKNEEALASGIYLNYSGGLSENLFEENISSKSALHNSIKKSFSDLIRNKILTNSQVDIIANKISDVYEMTNYTITSLGETKKFKENDDEYHAVHVTLKYPDIKKIIDQVTNNVKEEYNITTKGSLSENLSSPFYGIDKIDKKQFGESILNNYIKFSDKENISFKDIEYTVYIKKDKERNAYFIANNKIEGNKSIVDFLTRFTKSLIAQLYIKRLVWMIVSTLLLWSFYYLQMAIALDLAAKLNLGFAGTLGVFALSSLGMLLPSSPGAIGVYEAVAVTALTAYNVPRDQALAITLFVHMAQFIPVTVVGGLIFLAFPDASKDNKI